jgi:hypothetical protein
MSQLCPILSLSFRLDMGTRPTERESQLLSPPRKRGSRSADKGLDSRSPTSAEDKLRGNDLEFRADDCRGVDGAEQGMSPCRSR